MFEFQSRRLFWRACRLESRGDIEGAVAVEVDRGHDFEFYGRISSARRAYEVAEVAGHPHWSALAAYRLGELLSEQGDLDGALAAFEAAVSYDNPHFTDSARARLRRLRAH